MNRILVKLLQSSDLEGKSLGIQLLGRLHLWQKDDLDVLINTNLPRIHLEMMDQILVPLV